MCEWLGYMFYTARQLCGITFSATVYLTAAEIYVNINVRPLTLFDILIHIVAHVHIVKHNGLNALTSLATFDTF